MALRDRGIAGVIGAMGLVLALPAQSAAAQPMAPEMDRPAPDCSLVRVALPAELAGWSVRVPVKAAGGKAGLRMATLTVGQAVDAALIQTSGVRYVLRPEKPGGSVSYGGLFGFSVRQAATYRVALGAGAWIDVVKGGKSVASTAHGHGPDCTGIRKMVDFPLTLGRYVLQLAANGTDVLPVMVARLP
ncbi:MAG TPA: homogentisate 1,2-dioxygenase [Sphingobium sp.]